MSKENPTNLPPLQTSEQLQNADENFLASEKWWGEDIDECLLDFQEPYKAPSWTLSNEGVPFAPLGDLHGICGLSGHGKTWLMVQIMGALLKGEFGSLKCELPKPPTVLYCDTEQSRDCTIALKNRVCHICGHNPQEAWDRFKIVTLRECETVERWRKILKAVYSLKPTCVFVDGLLDILEDFNNNTECNRIITQLMMVCTHYKISLWCVLHLNPNGEKMTGHAGSILIRKGTEIFKCVKVRNDKSHEVHFEVTQIKNRGRDVPSWKFETLPVDDFGRVQMLGTSQEPDFLPQQNIEGNAQIDWLSDMGEWLAQALSDGALSEPCTLTDVKHVLRTYGGISGSDRLQRDVQALVNHRALIPQPKSEWQKAQKFPRYNINLS